MSLLLLFDVSVDYGDDDDCGHGFGDGGGEDLLTSLATWLVGFKRNCYACLRTGRCVALGP